MPNAFFVMLYWRSTTSRRIISSRTPHRRHRCLRHALYRLREVPTARFISNCYWWSEIIVISLHNIEFKLVNMKLWTLVDINRIHEKFGEYKLLIADKNWNDNGYYTLYKITYQQPKDFYNKCLGDIKIFNPNYEENYRASITDIHTPYVSFILDKICAMTLFLVLTPAERKELIETLHITFDCTKYQSLPVFKESVLRGYTLESFIKEQDEIKKLMLSDINPAHYISSTGENYIKNVLRNFSEINIK